ncbi:MAG: LamG-like jellyroll fold domain-containing protein [Chitinophagaceae bacterium]|jgi:hypothetical protein
MEGNSVKLTWTQENDNISGFALFRRAEGESITALAQTQKSTTQYLDGAITAGKKYTYYVLAVAGDNKSDTVTIEITPIFNITLSTGIVSEITSTSAKITGNITSAGGGIISSRGICWSTSQNPTINNSKSSEGTGLGQFISSLTGLTPGTTYYARAYGENSRGVVYGSQISFTTLSLPILTTATISAVTSTSAVSGGNISSDGGSTITTRGVCWSTSPNPTVLNTKTLDGAGTGSYTSLISNLIPSTTYYVRAYSTNSVGTSYGVQQTFTTLSATNNSTSFFPYINFNGINTIVQVGQTDISAKLNTAGSFTFEGWVKSTERTPNIQSILGSGFDGSGYLDYIFFLRDGRLTIEFRNGSNLFISTDFPNDTTWHHFALVYESKVATIIFIDGVEKIRSNNIGMQLYTSNNFSIGALNNSLAIPAYFLKGGIRQIRISSGALYKTNFNPILNNTINASTIAFWDLNEGTGTSLQANLPSYTGTLLNGTWIK